MNLGQIIILIGYIVGYVIGTLIIIRHLKGKISVLETRIETQSEILSNVEKFMNIFKLEEVEHYVDIIRKKSSLEKEEVLKKLEEKHKSEKKKVEETFKYFLNEIAVLFEFAVKLTIFFAFHPYLEKSINEMKESDLKHKLSSAMKESKEEIMAMSQDWMSDLTIKTAVLVQSGYFKKKGN